MEIKRDIMASSRNYTSCSSRTIKYIVIHGTGHVAPCKNFALNLKNNKCSGSAHYFVGDGEIRQVISDNNIAWHVGNPKNCYKVKMSDVKNNNSIGIEMCETNVKTGNVTHETIELTSQLVKMLMKKYNIPASRVIRHFDVLSKPCPTGFLTDSKWKSLKQQLVNGETSVNVTENYLAKVTCDTLNCRSGAGTNYPIVRQIHKGTVITIVATSGNRLQAKMGNWVHKNYMEYIRKV